MARRGLTEKELLRELENFSDVEAEDYSDDDSTANRNYSYEGSSYSSEDELAVSDVEDEAAEVVPLADIIPETKWEPVAGDRLKFNFLAAHTGVHENIIQKLRVASPITYFEHFIDDEIISLLVEETNRFAAQRNTANDAALAGSRTPRLNKWVDTDPIEMRKFLGIVVWMGLMHLPKLRDYWSTKRIYENGIPKILSSNRFEMLLSMFHLSNNEQPINPEDRLHKISNFLNLLEQKFKESYNPEEEVCIDESNVPFRGRIYFRQYIPNKRHNYGIKILKICIFGGYTWSFKVYTGKERADDVSVAEKIVDTNGGTF
ncbi:piggyBac transposable element-derived protein 4-like [Diabrotica virgifera virgifera]|uniref:PiggyBac transposable element-derived protein domain-containing protein n=1 Tax=Diabrotica virgifera virgifera TaxID=50390 RepID=A0ABM5K4G1_DIAVI|nr:piggyBac transposable element-derived protein 4-like [Diabrotica virgifera virgifera]